MIRSGKDQLEVASWHELAETSGQVIASHRGLMGLEGRPLYRALKDEPSEYLLFRMAWSDIRARTAEMIPSAGKSIKGKLDMDRGVLSWHGDTTEKGSAE
jgi:hypothetical protein